MQRRALLAALISSPLLARAGKAAPPAALDILKRMPFPPTDRSLFTPQVYGAPVSSPAARYTFSEQSIRSTVSSILSRRFNNNSAKVNACLAVYGEVVVKAVIPDARLRGALILLFGTVGEAAITAIRSGIYDKVRFGTFQGPVIAQVQAPALGGAKPSIVFNTIYQYENLLLHATTLAHETLHQDPIVTNREELINNSIDCLIYGRMCLETPALVLTRTELTRRMNTKLLARLNSRSSQGILRLMTARGPIFPGSSSTLANFAALFPPLAGNVASTPGNATLRSMLRGITGADIVDPAFSSATVTLLDTRQVLLSAAQLVSLATILKLDLTP